MRDLTIVAVAGLLALLTACSPGGGLIEVPQLGDQVQVPADVQTEYAHWEQVDSQDGWDEVDYDTLTRKQQRALAAFYFANGEQFAFTDLLLYSQPGAGSSADPSVEDATRKLGATQADDPQRFDGESLYWLQFDSQLTRGQLAWAADWILRNYSEIQAVTPHVYLVPGSL